MKIFAITCNNHYNKLTDAELFDSLDKAKARLKKMREERMYNFGVRTHKNTDMEFDFTLGWEAEYVGFRIIELEVK